MRKREKSEFGDEKEERKGGEIIKDGVNEEKEWRRKIERGERSVKMVEAIESDKLNMRRQRKKSKEISVG